MKSKCVWLWLGVLAFGFAFTSCSKDPVANLTDEESRIYVTDHDSSANFSAFKTFSVSDSVAVITNGQASKELSSVDQAFINAVKSEMQARGFALVNKSNNPDLGVTINRIYNTSTGIISYRNYYDYYGGYWDPFYWGYGGYGYYSPYSYATYTVRQGAVSIDMLDLKNAASNNNKIKVIWTGLIRGSGIFNATTAASQVKALFDQSTYLKP